MSTSTSFALGSSLGCARASPRRRVTAERNARPVSTKAFLDPATADAARVVLAAPVMYALVSFNEYVTHRYYQHAEFNKNETLKKVWCAVTGQKEAPKIGGGGHIEHHAETLDDMSLKTDDCWLNSDPAAVLEGNTYRGTAFEYDVTGLMTLQMLPTCIPVLAIMGYSLPAMASLILGSVLVHALIWNSLHPAMHGLNEVPIKDGIPSMWLSSLRSSKYYEYLYENHQGHHVLSGKKNYNVCAPLIDHLLGTYVPADEWKPKARMPIGSEHRAYYPAGEYAANLAKKALMQAVNNANEVECVVDDNGFPIERELVKA
jgi:hypothetical protein